MVKFLINRPISVIILVIGLLCLSYIAANRLNVALLPNIDIPEMMILVQAPQLSSIEVEQKVLTNIRRYLLAMEGLDDMESTANWGSGELNLRFAYGMDMDKAFIETNEMIDLSINSLPEDLERPRVIKTRAEDLPVYFLSLKYKSDYPKGNFLQLSEYAKEVFRRRLEQLPEIALVDIHGVKNRQIVITPNENNLSALGLHQQDLQKALEVNHMNLTSITIKERAYQYLVRIGKPLTTTRDIQNANLFVGDRVIKLGDLAKVSIEEQTATGAYEYKGEPAISLAIIKSPGASLNQLEEKLNQICEQIQKERPDIEVFISRDQTKLLRVTLDNLKTSLILGCLLAIGFVFFFYSQWRVPIIIGIIIPISLLLSLLFFYWSGLSLNMISLSGLLLGLGLMIDNGIIVLDNISQEWSDKTSIERACIIGTNEMIRPLLTSMLTTCSVFFPLIMISGIAGALFWEQALAVSIGLLTSYLISITLLPTLYFTILKRGQTSDIQKSTWFSRTSKKLYNYGFDFTFKYSKWILAVLCLFVVVVCLMLKSIAITRFPTLPEEAFELNIDWNAPIQPDVSARRISQIFQDIQAPWQAHIGISQYLLNALYQGDINSTSVYVTVPENKNPSELKSKIRRHIEAQFQDVRVSFSTEKTPFEMLFPTPDKFVTARCFISKQDEIASQFFFEKIINSIKSLPGIKSVGIPDYDKTYWIQPNLQNLMHYHIDESRLVAELKKLLSEHQLIELKSFQYSVPVVIKSNLASIEEIKQKGQIINREGVIIPMHQLIEVHSMRSLRKIHASKEGRFWPIRIDTDQPEYLEQQIEYIEQQYPSLKMDLIGAYKANNLLLGDIIKALLISLLLLYFLLTAQFESFLQPFIILLEIPVSLSGAILFLWLFGISINIMSLIGMVVMIGIIINDSIIKIDTINNMYRRGLSLKEAIHQGGLKRLNPIIMTSLTTILAVTPFLWGYDLNSMLQRPLALSLTGGMVVGTLMSLYIIPLFYFYSYKKYKT